MSLAKSYEPQTFEKRIYEFWEKKGCFQAKAENAPSQSSFCIVIPPPNVTGVLHMGHALSYGIEDILIRWRRQCGDNTLWLPGTDHAGIATQAQVEKQIAKEGKGPTGRPLTRHDLGREKFLQRIWKWKEDHHGVITSQLRRLGSSLDWSRERFTMDDGLSLAVREVFVRLFEEGLIYRGNRIINWCPRCVTALSDLEVIPTERKGHLWHISYPIDGEPGSFLTLATTRPETLLGDSAVAVHPEDERYKSFHGKKVLLPLLGRPIPILADPYVDRTFGTGVLKITPAHDFNDYEIGRKHALPTISVMGQDGKITAAGGPYAGLKFQEAREKILEDLKAQGLLAKVEDHLHKVGLCERCEHTAEPVISQQWFVKAELLAVPAIEAVKSGATEFTPKNWEKTYFEWMNNIRDWCISRQLWWGHQIPAWYCKSCNATHVAREAPRECSQCQSTELIQDPDVLDTWFSSALWPFSTLGWPEKTKELQTFYPTAILETGFDIIFFWVARMMMMGLHFMGQVPFRKVYLHAMVRDEKGEKMSKSKGNVIDPLVVMDQHGADALRFTLAAMSGQGRDIKLSLSRVEGYRGFCNKLWNAVKYFHFQKENFPGVEIENKDTQKTWPTTWSNRWILSRFQTACETVTNGLENFELNESSRALYEFIWNEFCDWYIELSKVELRSNQDTQKETLETLYFILDHTLRLSHPFLPFVTEELWQSLGKQGVLMLQPYPKKDPARVDKEAEKKISDLKSIVEAIRNFRGENNISSKIKFPVQYSSQNTKTVELILAFSDHITALTQIEGMVQASSTKTNLKTAALLLPELNLELQIALEGLVDSKEETERLQKELRKLNEDLLFVQNKLKKESFVQKAPAALVQAEKEKEQTLSTKIKEMTAALDRLN